MAPNILTTLRRQFDLASRLAHFHLDTLTTEECLWRPARVGPHVHQRADGRWIADWPEREDYDIGPASIAWFTWHIGFWWSMLLDHSFGAGNLDRASVYWPGDAEAARIWIGDLELKWLAHLTELSEDDLQSTALTQWPFKGRPFFDVIAWATVELTKNAAEIGYGRFLYAASQRDLLQR